MNTEPITPTELRNSRNISEVWRITRAIDNLKKFQGLNVGDVLVHKTNSVLEKQSNGLVQRWVLIHKDTYGCLYAKRFLLSGKLSYRVECITATTGPNQTWEVDTNYANSVILGVEDSFDPAGDILVANKERGKRDRVIEKNRRIDERNQN